MNYISKNRNFYLYYWSPLDLLQLLLKKQNIITKNQLVVEVVEEYIGSLWRWSKFLRIFWGFSVKFFKLKFWKNVIFWEFSVKIIKKLAGILPWGTSGWEAAFSSSSSINLCFSIFLLSSAGVLTSGIYIKNSQKILGDLPP